MLWSCFPWISPGHSLAAVTGVENLFNCIPKLIYQLNIYSLISIIYPLSPNYIYIYIMFSRNGSPSRPALDTWCPANAHHCGHPAPCPRSLAEVHVGSRNPRQCRCSIAPPGAAGPCYWQWCTGKWTPLDWWVGPLTPPFHKNLIYVMVGYGYICIEWILFWLICYGIPPLYYLAGRICKKKLRHYVMEIA